MGPKGWVTKVIIGHYADVLVRRKLAEEISRPKPKTKPRRAAVSTAPAKASTTGDPVPDHFRESGFAENQVNLDPPPETNKELKAELKRRGVKIPFAANKATLIALWKESNDA